MTQTYLTYPLNQQYIHNWLLAGPFVKTLTKIGEIDTQVRSAILNEFQAEIPGIDQAPNELDKLNKTIDSIKWRWYQCEEDHLIQIAKYFPLASHLTTWAYVILESPKQLSVVVELSSFGWVDLWVNNEPVSQYQPANDGSIHTTMIELALLEGKNEVLMRFVDIGHQSTQVGGALRLLNSMDQMQILIPNQEEKPGDNLTRQKLEITAYQVYTEKYVFGNTSGDLVNKNEPVALIFPENMEMPTKKLNIQLRDPENWIKQEGTSDCKPGERMEIGVLVPPDENVYELGIQPLPEDYFTKKMRFERRLKLFMARQRFVPIPEELDGSVRKNKVLKAITEKKLNTPYIEFAKMALDQWDKLDSKRLYSGISSIVEQHENSPLFLTGYLGAIMRYGNHQQFPKKLRNILNRSILNYPYALGNPAWENSSESRQILTCTSEILAGKIFAGETFHVSEKSGKWHQEQGEKLALAWMKEKGQIGFNHAGSGTAFDEEITALCLLIDYAPSTELQEMATMMMDKILYTIATNFWKGCYGGSNLNSDTASVLSARLQPVAGIAHLVWGTGVNNFYVMGTGSFACCKNYEVPKIIRKIALNSNDPLWSLEQHQNRKSSDVSTVYKATYRTLSYMLSSLQDHQPGERGSKEQVWQATMGPDAVVFVNHPASMSEEENAAPNFWRGNAVLPRVIQWGDTLVALHKLPADDWMGFTHAYFPTTAFDEYELRDGWAFARVDKAYLGLYASTGIQLITHGKTANRELRSEGKETVWVLQMGLEALDDSFDNFKAKVLGTPLHTQGLNVQYTNLRNEKIELGWQGSLCLNGIEQTTQTTNHYESMYCNAGMPADNMIIHFYEDGMNLDFNI